MRYYLGIDLGSSSIKIALTEAGTGKSTAILRVPETELQILSPDKRLKS